MHARYHDNLATLAAIMLQTPHLLICRLDLQASAGQVELIMHEIDELIARCAACLLETCCSHVVPAPDVVFGGNILGILPASVKRWVF